MAQEIYLHFSLAFQRRNSRTSKAWLYRGLGFSYLRMDELKLGFDMEHFSAAQKNVDWTGLQAASLPGAGKHIYLARPLSPSRDRELSICGPFVNLVAYTLHRSVAPASGTALPSRLVA